MALPFPKILDPPQIQQWRSHARKGLVFPYAVTAASAGNLSHIAFNSFAALLLFAIHGIMLILFVIINNVVLCL